jgi:short-subunit dehydrogenase
MGRWMTEGYRRFVDRYGPWAVVAGASEGLGAAFAHALAARGLNVVAVARRAEPLQLLVAELETGHGIQARAIALDLSAPNGVTRLLSDLSDLSVGLLVWNAALSLIGPFLEQPIEGHLRELEVNARAPLTAVHGLAGAMVSRGKGGIILMSSLSGLQGTALVAHYAATKAWTRVLAEGLWWEFGKQGVDVLACVAGATDTPGYRASAPAVRKAARVPTMSAEAVVEEALDALGRQPSLIAGWKNRWAAVFLARVLPRRAAVRLMGRTMDELYGTTGASGKTWAD